MTSTLFLRRLLAVALASSVAGAAEPSVEDRLRALENQVQQLRQENAELKQELGWKDRQAPVLVQATGKESKLILGGFLQAQAEFGRAADPRWAGIKDRFFFRRARIYVLGTMAEYFDFKAELDLQGNALTAGTGLMARANEIYLQWRRYPAATLRVGQIKPAFGAEALLGDTRSAAIERSLPNDRLTDGRQLGVGLLGELPDAKVGYLLTMANGNGVNASANDNSKFAKAARVYFTPLATAGDKVILGVDGLWADDAAVTKPDFGFTGNLFSGRRSAWGVDAQWIHGPLDLSVEYLHNTFKPAGAAEFDAAGWHAAAAYYLVPARVQALLRYEEFDPNTTLGGNRTHSWTAGLNYLIKGEDLRLMLDYMYGEVPGSKEDGGRLLTRMQLLF
jgi:phosphate-selective porin